jgi:hypothetical protein
MRASLRAETEVAVTAERMWDLLTDWPRQGEWILFTRVRTVAGDARRVGGRIEAWTGVGRIGFVDPMVVTRWVPPYSCEVLHTGSLIRGEGGFDVVELPADRARMVWWESIELPLAHVGDLAWRATRPLWSTVLDRALDRLRVLAETDMER